MNNFLIKPTMRYTSIFTFSFCCLLILIGYACGSGVDKTLLYGKWQAVSLTENGKLEKKDLSETHFVFQSNGQYKYQSNINYKEEGTFYLDGKFLVSRDTLKESIPKSVKVEYLSPDSMLFNMNNGGIPQLLGLKKVK